MVSSRITASSHNFAVFCHKLSLMLLIINFILISMLLLRWRQSVRISVDLSNDISETENSGTSKQKYSEPEAVANLMSTWERKNVYDFKFKEKSAIYHMLHEANVKEASSVVPNVPLIAYRYSNNGKPRLEVVRNKFFKNADLPKFVDEHVSKEIKDSLFLSPSDIHFSVRTTAANHQHRVKCMTDTWISLIPEEVKIFTDRADSSLEKYLDGFGSRRPDLIVVDCPFQTENKWALLCKIYWEYRTYLLSKNKKKWFCHFDDDTYVNVPSLLEMLEYFDPEKSVYIGQTTSDLKPITTRAYLPEIFSRKLSYMNDKEHNHSDPYRFVSFHFAIAEAGYCISNQLANRMIPFLQGPELIQTAASITLPDDCVIGFIITHLLNVSLIHSDVMHSGAVDLSHITEDDFFNLVTINVHFSKSSIQDKNAESTAEKTLANSTTVQFNETNAPKTIKSFELVQRLHKTFLKHLHT